MLKNYLIVAVRNLRRHLGYTTINVVGLAVGMAACLLIGLYVEDELSYDTFHAKADRIMGIGVQSDFFGAVRSTPYPLASTLASELPEVDAAVRLLRRGERGVQYEAGSLQSEQRVLMVDSTFFDVFTFPLERGNPATVLDAPHQAVITASMARTYFGEVDPIGRTLSLELQGEKRTVTVAGVARDLPSHSTIQFDMVVPMALAPPREEQRTSWGAMRVYTYALLNQEMDAASFAEKMQSAVKAHVEDDSFTFVVFPLSTLYLSDFYRAGGFGGQRQYVYLFGAIALLILLIAVVNYVNLVTAQAGQRAREVGVRKAMGARRSQVAWQFLGETALLSVTALGIGLLLVSIALPAFNGLFGKELTLWSARYMEMLGRLVAIVLVASVAAGAYPAFVLSGFRPIRVLRATSGATTSSGGWLRKGLVVTQFAVSAGLILSTVVIYQQLYYVQNKHLGFDGEQVVTVNLPVSDGQQEAVKQEVLGHPDVRRATIGNAMPGGFGVVLLGKVEDLSSAAQTERENVEMRPAKVDADYVEGLGLKLLAGRSFSADRPSDRTQAYVLNKAAAEAMGWTAETAIGKPFTFARGDDAPAGRVIGVVDNFHIESLRSEIEPVVLQREAADVSMADALAVKLTPGGIRAAMDHIEQVVSAVAPDADFSYTFLDDEFDAMYRSEQKLAQIFTVFAGLAILIACLGLFGLAAFAAQRRTKEIGIRKALGASLANVMGLLSKEFAALVAVALVIGGALAYWGMQRWLEDFAYHVEIGPTTFVMTAMVALVIAGGSVSYQALRAARTDPAKALRYE